MKRIHFHPPRKLAMVIFTIELGISLIYSATILISYLRARTENPLLANCYYSGTLEYIIASFSITLVTPFLIELFAVKSQ